MVVGASQIGLSISETADLLRFSCTPISSVYRDWSKKRENMDPVSGQKCLLDARGQTRIDRLFEADKMQL